MKVTSFRLSGQTFGARFHALLATAIVLSAFAAPAARAQQSGDTDAWVSATYAGRLARYYAPYALLAAAAYENTGSLDATRGPSNAPSLDGSDVKLALTEYAADPVVTKEATKYLQSWQYQFGHEGYLACFESDPDCLSAIGRDSWTFAIGNGPAFHVWARTRATQKAGAACSEVTIAFRGTTLSTSDWIANLDPVTGYLADDHYRQLRRNIDAIIRKITTLDCYKRARTPPRIVSVGHSLGGGLAQMAGLANNPSRPRISKVFAFDPSPVTGAGYVDKVVLAQNAGGLEIDRVYQSREVLEGLRKYYQQFPKASSPCVRYVVFDYFRPAGSVTLHNMPGLAREMVKSTYRGERQIDYETPTPLANCRSRYQAPATDEDIQEPPLAAGTAVSTRGTTAIGIARANRDEPGAYAMMQGLQPVSPPVERTALRQPILLKVRAPGKSIADGAKASRARLHVGLHGNRPAA